MNKYNIIRELGKGFYGTTYEIEYLNKRFALKKQKILESDVKRSLKSKIWRELDFYQWINKLSKTDQIFFMKLYEFKIEEKCEFKQEYTEIKKIEINKNVELKELDKSKYCLNLIVDLKDGVLDNLVLNQEEKQSLLIQIIYSIYLMRKNNWIHHDIHPGNICYKKVDESTKLILNIDGKKYKIPSNGYIFSLIDYGFCSNKKLFKTPRDKKAYQQNYQLNFDLWCFLEEYCFNYYNNNVSLKQNKINNKNFHEKITKYVYKNNIILYEKIKFIMQNSNSKLEVMFKNFEKTGKVHYLFIYDFAQYVAIYDTQLYYSQIGLDYKENQYPNELLEFIKINSHSLNKILLKLIKI